MTREEAISIMKVIVHMLEGQYDTDRVEDAVEMAIQALKDIDCEEEIGCDCENCTLFLKAKEVRMKNDR
jgi:hypothetical protein